MVTRGRKPRAAVYRKNCLLSYSYKRQQAANPAKERELLGEAA